MHVIKKKYVKDNKDWDAVFGWFLLDTTRIVPTYWYFQVMQINKKGVSCEIGNWLREECSLNTYNSNITELILFKECTDDITSYLK